jgi:hypothetical protein
MRLLRDQINHNALRLAIDRMGELVDDLHRSSAKTYDPDERKTQRLAADYVSDQRKDLQRLLR